MACNWLTKAGLARDHGHVTHPQVRVPKMLCDFPNSYRWPTADSLQPPSYNKFNGTSTKLHGTPVAESPLWPSSCPPISSNIIQYYPILSNIIQYFQYYPIACDYSITQYYPIITERLQYIIAQAETDNIIAPRRSKGGYSSVNFQHGTPASLTF